MYRRTFLQALMGLIAAPLLPKRAEDTAPPAYTDSENNDATTLAALHDGDTKQDGVLYDP